MVGREEQTLDFFDFFPREQLGANNFFISSAWSTTLKLFLAESVV
jgi:hypothetical protein